MEKVHEIQLTKKQNGLKYLKNYKSSTLPHYKTIIIIKHIKQ